MPTLQLLLAAIALLGLLASAGLFVMAALRYAVRDAAVETDACDEKRQHAEQGE